VALLLDDDALMSTAERNHPPNATSLAGPGVAEHVRDLDLFGRCDSTIT